MPGMRSPAQQALERPVEYATQADVQILAAEIRGLREAMEAELRAQRESTDVRFKTVEDLLEGQQELIGMLSSRIDQVDARLDRVDARLERVDARLERVDARFDSLLKWGIGLLVGAMVGFGGMIFGAASLITAGD